jgi:hypothetical protein
MNALPLNFAISERLRLSTSLWLGALPIALMFSSFLVIWPFAKWSAALMDIPDGAPVKAHPNGFVWLGLFLGVMVTLMVAGYMLGWLLDALLCLALFRWPGAKVKRVFLESDVPAEWLKDPQTITIPRQSTNKWEEVRKKGAWNFVLTRGVATWGILMYMIMGVMPGIRTGKAAFYFLWQGLVWATAGALFGFAVWYFTERSYLKNGRKEP